MPDKFWLYFSDVFTYTKNNWLDRFRQKFVSAWTNQTLNFRQTTTNRVEGMHAKTKSYLPSNRNSLSTIVKSVDQMVDKQYRDIKKGFEESLRKTMNHHKKQPLLEKLLRKVSKHALQLIYEEIDRLQTSMRRYNNTCGCQLYTSCALPCACRLEQLQINGN